VCGVYYCFGRLKLRIFAVSTVVKLSLVVHCVYLDLFTQSGTSTLT